MLPLALKYSKNARELGVGCGQFHSGVNGLTYSRQGQHSKNIFLAKTNSLVIRSIWAKKFLNLVESSVFYDSWLFIKQNGGSPCNLKMTSFAEIVRVAVR